MAEENLEFPLTEMEKYYKICIKNKWNQRLITKYLNNHKIDERKFKNAIFSYITEVINQDFFRLPDNQKRFLIGSKNYRFIMQYRRVIEEIDKYFNTDLNEDYDFSKLSSNQLIKTIYKSEIRLHNIINTFLLANLKKINFDLLSTCNFFKSLNLDTHDTSLRLARYELSLGVKKEIVSDNFKYLLKEEIKTPIETLKEIEATSDFGGVVEVFENTIVNVTTLINLLPDYISKNGLTKEDYDNLLEKLKFYNEYQIKKSQYDRKYGVVDIIEFDTIDGKKLIQEYLNSNMSLEEFLNNKNLSNRKFNYYLNLMKEKERDVYMEYKKSEDLIKIADTILYYLENGVIEDGVMRKFNLLDYFMLTNLSFEELYENEIKNKYSKKDLYTFRSFFAKNHNITPLNERQIRYFYEDKLIVNVKFDENNMPIIDSGHVVTDMEKDEIINFLREHNCLYERTLSLYTTKYFKDLEKEKIKKLVKEN